MFCFFFQGLLSYFVERLDQGLLAHGFEPVDYEEFRFISRASMSRIIQKLEENRSSYLAEPVDPPGNPKATWEYGYKNELDFIKPTDQKYSSERFFIRAFTEKRDLPRDYTAYAETCTEVS